jgi:predicted nucleic acid-binding protein
MLSIFLDTNILLRFFVRDDETKAQQALELLLRVEAGEEKIITSSLVIFETIFTLQRFYKVPRTQIKELLLPILSLRGVILPEKQLFAQALDLYCQKNISFADAYTAVFMLSENIPHIYSWDTDFDRIEGITRIEP